MYPSEHAIIRLLAKPADLIFQISFALLHQLFLLGDFLLRCRLLLTCRFELLVVLVLLGTQAFERFVPLLDVFRSGLDQGFEVVQLPY